MTRILKSMLSNYSYWLEKQLHITSIVWSILFLGCCCGLLSAVIIRGLIELWNKRKKQQKNIKIEQGMALLFFSAIPCTYLMNRLIATAYTWDSKLHRVMSNFQYVMSFESNKQIFTDALHLSAEDNSVGRLFYVALYLNDTQWGTVTKAAGGASWYFEKIQKAIYEILRLGQNHLTLGVIYQNAMAVLPGIGICLLAFLMWNKGKKKETQKTYNRLAVCLLLLAAMWLFGNLGAYIFLCTMLYVGVSCYWWTDASIRTMQKTKKKKTDTENAEERG